MLADSHAHLDSPLLKTFVKSLNLREDGPLIVSNSVDYESSIRNIGIARSTNRVKAFVGIHPEIFARKPPQLEKLDQENSVLASVQNFKDLIQKASGIGEIGLDPKYGSIEEQENLLRAILTLVESTRLPVTFHNRNTVPNLLEILPSYKIGGNIMFHWFAGSDSQLKEIQDRGIFASFGPSVIFSKRLIRLVEISDLNYILPETDSPTEFNSLFRGPGSPDLIASVVFKLSLVRKLSFETMREVLEQNTLRYLGTQN